MKKFELPEQPQKTNTSNDFTVAREAIANLDKFDYAWKTYSHKLEKRFTAAIKYIEELERENQRLRAENLAVKTLVEDAKKQQPEIPESLAKIIETHDLSVLGDWEKVVNLLSEESLTWLSQTDNVSAVLGKAATLCDLKIKGYTVAKEKRFYLKNKLTGGYIEQDCYNGTRETYNRHDRTDFTQSEIDSMETGSYEQIEVQE